MESKTIKDRRGLLNRRCQRWHVDRDHYSPLRGPGNARGLGAQSRVCAAQSGILSTWRPGPDFRPDRQVASWQPAKLQSRVRFSLRPRIARVAERLGTAFPRQITRIRVPSLAPTRPRCFWLHACLPGRKNEFDPRWSLSRTVGREVRLLLSMQEDADPSSARCLPGADFREVISFVRRQGGSTPTSGSAGRETGNPGGSYPPELGSIPRPATIFLPA